MTEHDSECRIPSGIRPFDRSVPPVVGIGMASLATAVVGGVLVAAQFGTEANLALPRLFVVVAIGLEIVAITLAATIRPFAWRLFRLVFGVGLLAYLIQGGLIAWTFAINDVPAEQMIVLYGGLVVFTTIVPLMLGFTVARYQAVDAD